MNRSLWHIAAYEAGASDEEWQRWQDHEKQHDQPGTLTDQLNWLERAGFSVVECVWRYAAWGTIHCRV